MPHVDYYLSLNSPWAYLGTPRLIDYVERSGATITVSPIDFALVFPATGGLPLPKRAPARQAYRLMELERWQKRLGLPLIVHPANWPADETLSAGMVFAIREAHDEMTALRFTYGVLKGVWADNADNNKPETLIAVADALGLDGKALAEAGADPKWVEARKKASEEAISKNVFGAPSYVIDGEVFWGQDRLDFVAEKLGVSA